jgi:NAD(P)-dependent dehydrogenase (short-subunit alcohol dehydrogenase family)
LVTGSDVTQTWKTAWIVGGSTGIGREIARQLQSSGVSVAISSRRPPEYWETPDEPFYAPVDVTSAEAVRAGFDAVVAKLGHIDLVVIASGIYEETQRGDIDLPQHTRHVMVNYLGSLSVLSCVIPHMKGKGSGAIAIVASVAGYRGLPKSGAYGPTKAALINLAENLRIELNGTGVTIHLVNPGFVDTPMTRSNTFPMPALLSAQDAAQRTLQGLSAGKFEIVYPWRFVVWLKLARILPYPLYFWFAKRLAS